MKNRPILLRIFLVIWVLAFSMTKAQTTEYRILVLPSGGATGIIPATLLQLLEEKTNKPVHELFDEIWGSSIGAIMATLLTVPEEPRSAAEVVQFIEQTFSHYYSAARIRGRFRALIPPSTTLNDTRIPIRILSAKVIDWHYRFIPKKTELQAFCKKEEGNLCLASIACSSCSVPPVHRTEPLDLGDGAYAYCLDAGHELCGSNSCMNPMFHLMKKFSSSIDPEKDTISIFFLSNGWVRLGETCEDRLKECVNNQNITVKLFNIDADLDSAIEEWKQKTWTGWALKKVGKGNFLDNLAGMGAVPTGIMKKIAEEVAKGDEFNNMVKHLNPVVKY